MAKKAPKDRSHDPAQYLLDFSSALDDKRRRLRQALERTPGRDLKQWTFLLWICHIEDERAGLVRDYDQIADWLWCSRSAAIRMVNFLADVGLLKVQQTFDADGSARKNQYRINWSIVERKTQEAIAKDFGVGVSQCQGDTAPCQGDTSSKEYILNPVLVYKPEPVPEKPKAEPLKAKQSGKGSGPPRMASHEDELRIALFAELPELREARQRELTPLPPGELLYGPWIPIVAKKHFRYLEPLLVWHRRQLSLPSPVCGSTVADFLLTMCAAIHAKTFEGKILKSREAIFVSALSRRLWDKLKRFVPRAAGALAEWEASSALGLDFSEQAWLDFEQSPATSSADFQCVQTEV